ncbi:MAG: ribbon-helix-helix domain-containing protein [Candidatus Bathyarchaeia archaeon]
MQQTSETGKKKTRSFCSVSLPAPLIKKIEKVVGKLGYWPTKTAFIREACLEKLDKYKIEESTETG